VKYKKFQIFSLGNDTRVGKLNNSKATKITLNVEKQSAIRDDL